jgi:hypothetical protein
MGGVIDGTVFEDGEGDFEEFVEDGAEHGQFGFARGCETVGEVQPRNAAATPIPAQLIDQPAPRLAPPSSIPIPLFNSISRVVFWLIFDDIAPGVISCEATYQSGPLLIPSPVSFHLSQFAGSSGFDLSLLLWDRRRRIQRA